MNLNNVYDVVRTNKNEIVDEWLDAQSVSRLLKNIKFTKEVYKEDVANPIIEYFLKILKNEARVDDCPAMRKLVETFLYSGLCAEDVFLNCTILKNFVVETLFLNSIDKHDIRETTNILDTNLYRILSLYTKQKIMQDSKFIFHEKLIEEHVALSITNIRGEIIYVTEAFCKLTGYDAPELLGKTHRIIRHEKMSKEFFKKMWKQINQNNKWNGRIVNRKKDGGEFIAKTEIIPYTNAEGKVIEYVAIRHDITDKELLNIDPLTNIFNRRYYRYIISDVLQKSDEVSLMIIDIDFFKDVNDKFGHDFGDLVLIEFSKILTKKIRPSDVCVRWGGEEFLVLLPDTHLQRATQVAQRIRTSIESLILLDKVSGESVDIRCSIGVTQHREKESESKLFKRADSNLYEAKDNGRNMVISS